MPVPLPEPVYPTESILFVGSGFSRDARNILNQNLPTGTDLRNKLATLLGCDEHQYDLQTLAEEAHSRADIDLYQLLYEVFTVNYLQDYQAGVLNFPWRRIYTTNYDDTVEFHRLQKKEPLNSFNYDDDKPRKLPQGSVIHLHGTIRAANRDNLLEQLILNDSSYARQHFNRSLWYDDFTRDLRFCEACFFVGYSMNDYHVSALLLQSPALAQRTYFITPSSPDQIFANRVQKYGSISPVGIHGFWHHCAASSVTRSPARDIHSLKSFRYIDPHKDRKTLNPPTAPEIFSLLTYGTFNYQRCLSTLPTSDYVVARHTLVQKAATLLQSARCLLVHSLLGNGKTLFLNILAYKLSELGYRCFHCHANSIELRGDAELLQSFSKLVILFDSYDSAIELIEELVTRLPQARYVVAVRTGIHDVRLHEIQSRFPAPQERINVNGFHGGDMNDLRFLIDKAGVRPPHFDAIFSQCKDFREVVLSLYGHQEVARQISIQLQPLLGDVGFKRVLVASLLLKRIGQEVDAGFLRSVTYSDGFAEISKFPDVTREIFRLEDGGLQVKSAIFAEYLILHHMTSEDIVESVHAILIEAVKRKGVRRYQAMLSNLMRFSMLDGMLTNDPQRSQLIIGLYERLRRDVDINNEPLFWLQYSILMTTCNELEMAEEFISTAYARAADIRGFRTFQIDTYALRLLLLVEQRRSEVGAVERFDDIVDKLTRVRGMIGESSRRVHAVEVLLEFEPFIVARVSDLSREEANGLIYHLALAMDDLEQLTADERALTGSDEVWASLARARDGIVAHWSTAPGDLRS